jgi:hypothetical protein
VSTTDLSEVPTKSMTVQIESAAWTALGNTIVQELTLLRATEGVCTTVTCAATVFALINHKTPRIAAGRIGLFARPLPGNWTRNRSQEGTATLLASARFMVFSSSLDVDWPRTSQRHRPEEN